jgi:hypothetical protein
MATEPKQNDGKPPQRAAGCWITMVSLCVITGIFALFLLFHPFGPALFFQWREDSATLEAAQDTARVFLDAVRNEDGNSAYGLLSKDYRERLPPDEHNARKLKVPVAGGQRIIEYEIGAGKLSKDEGLATFECSVQTKDGEHPCRLVMVKEGRSWRVDLFTVRQ